VKVYAFEWCDCIHESAFGTVSLHATKRGAFKAMTAEANRRCMEDAAPSPYLKKMRGWIPLRSERWQVRTIEVQP
jgi:hypothetical protein